MFRKATVSGIALLALLSLTGIGCDATDPNGLDPGETDDVIDSKADGSTPLRMGTYDVAFGVYYSMELDAIGTYHLTGGCKPGPTGPHCFAITIDNGTYRLTKSGSHKYIRLYSDFSGGLKYRFQYTVSGKHSQTVHLTDTHDDTTSTATLENADMSQDGESCGGFSPSINPCAPGLSCKATVRCCDMPGVCVHE